MKSIFFLALLTGLLAGCATTSKIDVGAQESFDHAQAVVSNWNVYSRVVAVKLLAEYGPPQRIEPDRLVWRNASPWSRIAVWDTANYYPEAMGSNSLEQTLLYEVPQDKRQDLAAFSDKLVVSQDGKELSVLGNSESFDFLALNLADEIVRGKLSPEGARSCYDRIYRLSQAGKSSPYTQGLLFSTNRAVLPRGSEERGDFLHTPLDIWQY
jgi:hypothetical protein